MVVVVTMLRFRASALGSILTSSEFPTNQPTNRCGDRVYKTPLTQCTVTCSLVEWQVPLGPLALKL